MNTLIEEKTYRNKTHIFKDRQEAGKLLAQKLLAYKDDKTCIVFGIPSGGVPIASEIAKTLAIPFDIIIVRKIQIPYNTEAGFGAVTPDGSVLFNETFLKELPLSEEEIKRQVLKTKEIIKKRDKLFRKGRPFPVIRNKTVIIADDGLASGYTMLAAIRFIREQQPQKIITAVPTGSEKTVHLILPEVDELICLNVRSYFPFAVADAYKKWYDLADDEVISIVKNSWRNRNDIS